MSQNVAVGAGPFRILIVCTGNVCRSVIAERLARRGLRARLGAADRDFRVASAGTASVDGGPVHPFTAAALAWLGADAAGHASRPLAAADIDAADLVLTAGVDHLNRVIALRPSASRRSFLLREFARIAPVAAGTAAIRWNADSPAGPRPAGVLAAAGGPADDLPAGGVSYPGWPAADRARQLVAEVARWRGRVPYVEPAADEITDPAASQAAFLACGHAIDAAVSDALDALCRADG
jgi:protein-tyrosine phosphatase